MCHQREFVSFSGVSTIMLQKVISGGQTGVDIAGVKAARAAGFETGGWMPWGYKTDEGNRPAYRREYNMLCTQDRDYPTRTRLNIRNSCATLLIATNFRSQGTRLTAHIIDELGKPSKQVQVDIKHDPSADQIEEVTKWIRDHDFKVLNVAGNSEGNSPGIEEWTFKLLENCFTSLRNQP
ncbi:MAG: hypothetical protein FJ308_21260 [Planctomycetes bacterium]|nr:hypothetical protein [Planctomycetota bacterium]